MKGQPSRTAEPYDDEDEFSDESEDEGDEQSCGLSLVCLLLILGGGVCAFGVYTGSQGQGSAWVAYIVAGTGLLLAVMSLFGCVGFCSKDRPSLLASYFSFLLFVSLALWIAAGYCFVYAAQASTYIASNWADIQSREDTGGKSQEELQLEARRNLQICGAIALCCVMFGVILLVVVSNVIKRKRAIIAFMQVSTTTLLPIGAILIMGALYIADAAAVATTPVTSFSLFILGCLVISVALLGCFSTAISSRGLLLLFIYIVLPVGVAMFGFSIYSVVAAEQATALINDNWDQIRLVLPPTFSGRYDREAFTVFLAANLIGLAFLGGTIGVLLIFQAWGAKVLRVELKRDTLRMENTFGAAYAIRQASLSERPPEARPGPPTEAGARARPRPPRLTRSNTSFRQSRRTLRKQWKEQWTKGSKTSRRVIKVGCCCLGLGILTLVASATAALVFSTSCDRLRSVTVADSFSAPVATVGTLNLATRYSRGKLLAVPQTSATSTTVAIAVETRAIDATHAKTTQQQVTQPGVDRTFRGVFVPVEGPKLFSFDTTCQGATVTASLPRGTGSRDVSVKLFSASDYDGVEVNGAGALSLRAADLESEKGAVVVSSTTLGAGGLRAVSASGEVLLTRSTFVCGASISTSVAASALLGGVRLLSSSASDCPIVATTSFGPVVVSGLTQRDTVGQRSTLRAVTEKGAIQVQASAVPLADLNSEKGSVRTDRLNVTRSVLVSTQSGEVRLCNTVSTGNIEIETTSGDVHVHIPLEGFSGLYAINTKGKITLTGPGIVRGTSTTETQGTINCSAYCEYYGGELLITSSTGDVTVTVGGACDPEFSLPF